MGTESEPVPVTGFAENFSPIPCIAPPPFGRLICGAVGPPPNEDPAVSEDESDDAMTTLGYLWEGNLPAHPLSFGAPGMRLLREICLHFVVKLRNT